MTMTKYEELCEALQQSTKDSMKYREKSMLFVGGLLTGFVSYIGAPPDRVKYLPPEPRDPNTIYTPAGAVKLQEDGWWEAYVQLTLVYPELKALFLFRTRIEADTFTVRVGDSERTHAVLDGDATALEPIYEEAFTGAKEYFTGGLQRFLDEVTKPAAPRKI